jgi:hypothetical protein
VTLTILLIGDRRVAWSYGFQFQGGYKEWFANGTRQTLYATLTRSVLRHWRETARYRIATEVKRFRKLDAAIRNARSRFGR